MVKGHFLFAKLDDAQRTLLLKVMRLRVVKNGEVIIREGEAGDEMYVIDR